jgi:phage-related protein
MSQQTVPDAIQDIRICLQYSAQYLREFDEETSEAVAKKLDRLRAELKRLAEKQSS